MRSIVASALSLPLFGIAFAAAAQDDSAALGKWKTYDDVTGKAMSITEVYRTRSGAIAAKVVETLNKPNATCDKCTGALRGKPITGMVVFLGRRQDDGALSGTGFKPSTGMTFKVKRVRLVDDGDKLEITGCKLVFCRTAMWERVR